MSAQAWTKFEVVKTELDELKQLCAEIEDCGKQFVTLAKTTLEKAIRAGELLCYFKEKAGHGKWESWVKTNLPIGLTTAKAWMTIAKGQENLKSSVTDDLTIEKAYRLTIKHPDQPKKPRKSGSKKSKKGPSKVKQLELQIVELKKQLVEQTPSAPVPSKQTPAPEPPKSQPAAKTMEVWTSLDWRCVITEPLPSWRVVNREGSDKHQIVVCIDCWRWTTGGIVVAAKDMEYSFQCGCKDSYRKSTHELMKAKNK